MKMFDRGSSKFLKRLFIKGEKQEMKSLLQDIVQDDSGENLVASSLLEKQRQAYEATLEFLKHFDKTVAMSFVQTNAQLRGELGIFYDKLIEELK